MQRLIACLAAVLLTASIAPLARADEWKGFQTITAIHGDIPLEKTERVHLRASAHLYWEPATGVHMFFFYAGPRFVPTKWLSIAPQVGLAGRWTPGNGNAFLASVWTKLKLAEGAVIIFLEGDIILANAVHDYYGYYEVFITPPWKVPVGFGGQAEQVNTGFKFGPQIGATFGPFSVALQYFAFPTSPVGHAVRGVFTLSF